MVPAAVAVSAHAVVSASDVVPAISRVAAELRCFAQRPYPDALCRCGRVGWCRARSSTAEGRMVRRLAGGGEWIRTFRSARDQPRWEPFSLPIDIRFPTAWRAFRPAPAGAISIVNSTRSQGLTSRARHGREEFRTKNRDRRRSRPYGGTLSGLGPPEFGQLLTVGSA